MTSSMITGIMILVALCQEFSTPDEAKSPVKPDISNPPAWLHSSKFKKQNFYFTRAKHRAPSWATDYPEADLHFVAKINSTMSLSAEAFVAKLEDLDQEKTDLLYFSHPGQIQLSKDEKKSLRDYLQSGGFAMFDDSWGNDDLERTEQLLSEVLPGSKCEDLQLNHPIFKSVFRFDTKPQVPTLRTFTGRNPNLPELEALSTTHPVRYLGVKDDQGRLLVLVCHNTDTGDGWERDEDVADYKRDCSDPLAYPLGINIVHFVLNQ